MLLLLLIFTQEACAVANSRYWHIHIYIDTVHLIIQRGEKMKAVRDKRRMKMNVSVPLGFTAEGINTAWHSSLAVFVTMATATYMFQTIYSDTVAEIVACRFLISHQWASCTYTILSKCKRILLIYALNYSNVLYRFCGSSAAAAKKKKEAPCPAFCSGPGMHGQS